MLKKHFIIKVAGLFVLGLGAWGMFQEDAVAQTPAPLSPWLFFNQKTPGAILDPYHNNVLPRQRAIEEFSRQDNLIKRQDAQQRNLSRDLDNFLHEPNKLGSVSGRQGAGYRQYLHFYQGLPSGGVPNYSPAGAGRRY